MFGALIISLVVQLIAMVLLLSGANKWSMIGIAVAMIIFYGAYVIVDVHMIRDRIEIDDYIIGAITLYIDLMSMLIYILMILGKKK
jgi:FtsH-binding integral membrane protein